MNHDKLKDFIKIANLYGFKDFEKALKFLRGKGYEF